MEINMLVFYFVSEIDEDFSISIISEASTEMLCVCKNTESIWNLLPSLPSQVLNSLLPVSLYCICCQQVVPLYWISTPYAAFTPPTGEFGGLINVLGLYFAPWTVPEQFLQYVRVQCCADGGRSCLGHEGVYNIHGVGRAKMTSKFMTRQHWTISLAHLIWTPWFRISQPS